MYAYHVLVLFHGFIYTIFDPSLAFFRHDMKTEIGVVIYMYLKHSPNCIDSKYI